MQKLLSLVLVSVVLGGTVARADTFVANTAKNQRGEEVHPLYGGYSHTRVAAAGVAASQVVCTGRCVLAGLIPSTGGAGSSIRIFDTSVAALAGNMVDGNLALSALFGTLDTSVAINRVPLPMRFANGITVQLNSVAEGQNVTVLYVDLDQR